RPPARSLHDALPIFAALGTFLAVSVKLSMLPLVIGCLVPLLVAPPRAWRAPAIGLALALAGHGLYDLARFGNPLETGYGVQATRSEEHTSELQSRFD